MALLSCQNPLGPLLFESKGERRQRLNLSLADGQVQAEFRGFGEYRSGFYNLNVYVRFKFKNPSDRIVIQPDSVQVKYLGHQMVFEELQDVTGSYKRDKGEQVFRLEFDSPASLDEVPLNVNGHLSDVPVMIFLQGALFLRGQRVEIEPLTAWERKADYGMSDS